MCRTSFLEGGETLIHDDGQWFDEYSGQMCRSVIRRSSFYGGGPICRKLETVGRRFDRCVAGSMRLVLASLCAVARTTGIDGGFMNRLDAGQAGRFPLIFV